MTDVSDNIKTKVDNLSSVVESFTEKFSGIQTQPSDLLKSVNDVLLTTAEVTKTIDNFKSQISELESRLTNYELKCNALERENKVLHERVISIESHSRRDNLLLDGIPESPAGIQEDCLKIVKEVLQNKLELDVTRIDIVRCHRKGFRKNPQNERNSMEKPRPIIFNLHNYNDRQTIWESRFKLKNTKIFLNEDFPHEINQRRKTLFPIMKAAKKQEKDAFLSVDKLHIVSKDSSSMHKSHLVVTVDSLHKLPRELDSKFVTTSRANDCFAFFGELCPISNFHPAPISYKGKTFKTSEHVYQYCKAEDSNDQIAMRNILASQTPLEAKRIGDRVIPSSTWDTVKENIMASTLRAKFSQNPTLKSFLLEIQEKTIAEASSSDLFWGTGIGLFKKETNQVNLFKGQNKLGVTLQKLREEFQN